MQKKLFTEHEFEKCCEAKKKDKGHITGRRKNFNKKKSKLKVWHSLLDEIVLTLMKALPDIQRLQKQQLAQRA